MFWRTLTTVGLVGTLAIMPAEEAQADAGDFIGGAIVGGLIGHAITKDQQRRRATTSRTVTRTRTYRPRIPVTEQGRQTQTALNYFGYNAGRVDGQVGRGTRGAIERYQASMGYPINGRDFQPYQFDFLMNAYYWATSGGAAQTRLSGQPLLMAYRQQMQQGNTAMAAAPVPQVVQPAVPQVGQTTTVVVPAPQQPQDAAPSLPTISPVIEASTDAGTGSEGSLPNLFAGSGAPSPSLADSCNAVMLQTTTNGGYTTLANLSDGDFALKEQFCLARSYAIERGKDLMAQVSGLTPQQIAEQCGAFGDMLSAQTAAVSTRPQSEAQAAMRTFADGTGIATADLAATSRVCLGVGYSEDDMDMSLGAALMLVALGEPAYGELLGHHLRGGFGTPQRPDLAVQWFDASLAALEGGAPAVFMPGEPGRPDLIRAAVTAVGPAEKQGILTAPETTQPASLPTFTVSE